MGSAQQILIKNEKTLEQECIFDKGQTSVSRWSMGRSWKIYGPDRTPSVFASSASFADHLPVFPSHLFSCMLKRRRMSQDGPRLGQNPVLFHEICFYEKSTE